MKHKLIIFGIIIFFSFFAKAQKSFELNEKAQQFFNNPWVAKPKV